VSRRVVLPLTDASSGTCRWRLERRLVSAALGP
jgi:hypothetical protein